MVGSRDLPGHLRQGRRKQTMSREREGRTGPPVARLAGRWRRRFSVRALGRRQVRPADAPSLPPMLVWKHVDRTGRGCDHGLCGVHAVAGGVYSPITRDNSSEKSRRNTHGTSPDAQGNVICNALRAAPAGRSAGDCCRGVTQSGAWPADVCFHDCGNARRPARLVLCSIPRVSCVGASPATAADCASEQALRRPRAACAWAREAAVRLRQRQLRAHRLPHHRGDAAVSREARDEWTSSGGAICFARTVPPSGEGTSAR